MPSAAVRVGGLVYLYYSGWSRSTQVPYINTTGLAVSEDGGRRFRRMFDGPVLGRGPHEPYSATSPCILIHEGIWHMWYCSGALWQAEGDAFEPVYHIKHAASVDGMHWRPDAGRFCIPPHHPLEASTRPTIARMGDRWHLWFCHRDSRDFRDGVGAYRLGYAWSTDLTTWCREDWNAGLVPADHGWDSIMVAYPEVVETPGGWVMFYNGNGFGVDGVGWARLAAKA
ncbi:hypothetical protein A6A04_10590 [Paramagnetospirillum marisnigri]|uniref:Glycosyl hydrolase family 32 N-terminal domain-containing protein n=2 Tax=Paramagnetospirillum marisnigri TaxID=1285242 RepID=A0A178MYB5_9PROT|nr:hypothetical protein A6A04_10590 [Paramagnetospirillum marisnigri]